MLSETQKQNSTKKAPKQTTIHDLLIEEAAKHNWPVHCRVDLVKTDKERLQEEDAPTVFAWVLRECGTEILDMRMTTLCLQYFIEHYEMNGKTNRYYFYNGNTLRYFAFAKWVKKVREVNRNMTKPAYGKDYDRY